MASPRASPRGHGNTVRSHFSIESLFSKAVPRLGWKRLCKSLTLNILKGSSRQLSWQLGRERHAHTQSPHKPLWYLQEEHKVVIR